MKNARVEQILIGNGKQETIISKKFNKVEDAEKFFHEIKKVRDRAPFDEEEGFQFQKTLLFLDGQEDWNQADDEFEINFSKE